MKQWFTAYRGIFSWGANCNVFMVCQSSENKFRNEKFTPTKITVIYLNKITATIPERIEGYRGWKQSKDGGLIKYNSGIFNIEV